MTVSTSSGKMPICLNDVLTAGHMYSVLVSTTMFLPSALISVEVEWASFRPPSSSRSRNPMQRMSSCIMIHARMSTPITLAFAVSVL